MGGYYLVFLLTVGLLATTVAEADWTKIKSTDFEIAEPPAPDSPAYRRDFKILEESQSTRTQAQCDQANRQVYPTVAAFYEDEKSPSPLSKKELERAKPVLEKVVKLSNRIAVYFKGQHERSRPYDAGEGVTHCVKNPPTGKKAYPSSHAAVATATACVLSEVFPKKSEKLLTHGKELGDLRFIVGVHHPSDVEAGQRLGEAICERLFLEKDFKEEIEGL